MRYSGGVFEFIQSTHGTKQNTIWEGSKYFSLENFASFIEFFYLRFDCQSRTLNKPALSRISSLAFSLVLRPVRAIRVTRGGLEPSANFPDKLDR